MLEIVEIDAVVDVHVAVDIRQADLDGDRKRKRGLDLLW
jgi:hypothetical protein